MKTNEELQKDVQESIQWEPLLHAAEIGVTASSGVITLTGTVDSYGKKMQAEEAAKKVLGVKAVVENIDIFFGSMYSKQDSEIVGNILTVYQHDWKIPEDKVKIKVEKGWVTLEGEFNWYYQKEAAAESIRNLPGVKGITNDITIKAAIKDEIEKEDIESALHRNPAFHNQNIKIDVSGTKVTLSGKVDSWYQKEEAARVAWKTPGIDLVNNKIEVNN